ncbi:adenyl-nucleotide exchange factor sse1 [Gonapodya sp. JEL0774]|nr:adenyl-nucleotide exchange factor sse1 [Gonapodya sp. JEL0774]
MSVVGIDFGNLNTAIAVARNRGIDVIANETSNRLTPSMVGFGHKQRSMGEQAKSNEISNFRNTIHTLKRLAGRPYSDPEVRDIEAKYLNCQLVEHAATGEAAAQVHYLGEQREFTFTQLCAAYFTKVKAITAHETKAVVSDVVLSVPGWFGDRQRRALLDAAEIAGLNVLRLMNDETAAALGYGITKTDLPEPNAKPRRVVIVDIGHSSTQSSCVEFVKGQLRVRGSAYDRNLGGRDFDFALAEKAAVDAEKKYKGLEIRTNKRAMYRLRVAAERAKKMLSANTNTVLSVESIVDDRDISVPLER